VQSPQKQIPRRVSAAPVAFGIVVEVLFAAGLCLPHTSNPPITAFCAAEAPYLLVLFMLLIPAADSKRMQFWAGVAFGLGLLYAVLSAIISIPYAIGLGLSDYPGKWVQEVSLIGLIPVNLYVAFAANAVRQGGSLAQRIVYPILKTAGAFVLIVLGVWAHGEYDESRRIQRLNSMLNETQLIQVMNHVLACLQRYKLEKSSYPDNLAATASVRGCSSLDANPGKVVGYTLSYGPIGPAPGKAESFQLEARSEGGWFQHADPYIADSSGIIYGHTQFAVRAMGGSEGAMVLPEVRRCVERPASAEQNLDGDGIVRDLQNRCPYRPGQWENQDGVVVFRMAGNTGYVLEIHLVLTGGQPALKISGSGRCTNYAMNCVRSYLMDEKGAVHGTPEPRAATIDDLVVPACESSAAPCDWPLVK
jgi:hypothetical protein